MGIIVGLAYGLLWRHFGFEAAVICGLAVNSLFILKILIKMEED